MLLADSKYKLLVESKERWGIANPQEEKISALEAKIAKMWASLISARPMAQATSKRKEKAKGKDPHRKNLPLWTKPPPKGDMKNPFKPR